MRRILIVVGGLAILVCFACLVFGALFILVQPTPIAQVSSVPGVTEAAPKVPPAIVAPTPAQTVSASPQTANGITVTVSRFTNQFPDQLTFGLQAHSKSKITQIALFVAIDLASSSSRQVPDFTPDTQVETTYQWNLNRNYLPPGVTGQFWWTVQDSSGAVLETSKQAFRVDDVAHQWKKISNDKLALYWYTGDDSFGQAIFDRGVQAMNFLQQDTGVTVDNQIQIFIYGNRTDFFSSLEPGASEWTGGRAFPEYGIVLIDIAPSNLDWGLGATTHELTHQVIHQKIKSPLGDLSMPHWTDEGLAVYYETYPGMLDSQFAVPLRRAIQNDSLQPLRSLSGGFPADSTAANLSYAESYSVVDFIIRHYGRDKLAQLLQAFKAGGFYDDIFMQVLNVDTDGLENLWRQDAGAKPRAVAPRVATTPTAFPTFSLSTDATPTPGK
jgi:hypothetical protein